MNSGRVPATGVTAASAFGSACVSDQRVPRQAVGAPEEQDAGGRRGHRRDEGGASELQEKSAAALARAGRLAFESAACDARQLIVGPPEREAPREHRGKHPGSAQRRPRRDSVQLVLDDQGDAAQNRAENCAEQQGGFAREPEQREQQRAAGGSGD